MLNILILEDDAFYRQGIMTLLRDLINREFCQEITFSFELCSAQVEWADIVIADLQQGAQYLCLKALKEGKAGVIVSFITDEFERHKKLPACLRNALFIDRKSSVAAIRQKIIDQLYARTKRTAFFCSGCIPIQIPSRQEYIINELLSGLSVAELAKKIAITEKAIYAHKYMFMRKFNLSGNFELIRFLKRKERERKFDAIYVQVREP